MTFDAAWVVGNIGAFIHKFLHIRALEDRIHALENVITNKNFFIMLLSAGLVILLTYIFLRKCIGVPRKVTPSIVSPTMKDDTAWVLWNIFDIMHKYLGIRAMEERIHTLENVITNRQCVIVALSAGLVILLTYIFLGKH